MNLAASPLFVQWFSPAPSWLGWSLCGILIISFVLTIGLSYRRLAHHHLPKRRFARLALVTLFNGLAIVSLIFLLSESYIKTATVSRATLITQGAAPVLDGLPSEDPVFVLDSAKETLSVLQRNQGTHSVTVIQQAEQILGAIPQLQQLHVIGDGLSPQQWQTLNLHRTPQQNALDIRFRPSPPRLGLIDMHWRHALILGQVQQLKGRLQLDQQRLDELQGANLQERIFELQLLDPAGDVINRVRLQNNDAFQFRFAPKRLGVWQYQLKLFSPVGQSELLTENVAFEVKDAKRPTVLIKQSAPSFETRHLQNWAASLGSAVTIETQISKFKTITQYLNRPLDENSQSDSVLDSSARLKTYDWLLIDGRGLLNLSAPQGDNLNQALAQGLGVLVVVDTQLLQTTALPELLADFSISSTDKAPNRASTVHWAGRQTEQPLPHISATIQAEDSDILVTDNRANPLVMAKNLGLGKVAISLINQTHQWRTTAQLSLYSHYWQYLITHLARADSGAYWLAQQDSSLFTVEQPQPLCARVNQTAVSASYGALLQRQTPLVLQPDIINNHQACTRVFISQPGWYQSRLQQGEQREKSHFYVYDKQDWSAWQQTLKYQASRDAVETSVQARPQSTPQALSKWLFWGCFILACSFLWLERKF